jgi:hypothetical protein
VDGSEWYWAFYYGSWELINYWGWQQIPRWVFAFFYRYPGS